MFNLNDDVRYYLYNQPTDMRKSFYSLSGIVSNVMGQNPLSGDAFIFINKERNRMKILRMERGGFVLYSKILECGRFSSTKDKSSIYDPIYWRELVLLVEGIVENKKAQKRRYSYPKNM